jgi:hypothetical protein
VEGSFGSLHAREQRWGGVTGLGIIVLGIVVGLVGYLFLRRSGSGWRIGRLLAAAPQHTLAETAALAAEEGETYVRLHGRIDSDEEFPGDDGRPIVYRRRRLQRRAGRAGWQTFDDDRMAVPFRLSEEGEHVSIDADALGDGLVAVPRESEGVASDLTEDAVSGELPAMPPETPVRLRIEHVSAVEHATAAGVPRMAQDGSVMLGPGLGRPLLLTTLEIDDAMRVLAGGRRTELLISAGLLIATPLVVGLGLIALVLGL